MRTLTALALSALLLICGLTGALAQSVADGSDAALGTDRTQALLALVARQPLSTDARVTGLRIGRGGAVCGAVEVKNRMGVYTGPRPFVADLTAGFAGKLPEGPELRSPGSMAAFRDMERTQSLYAANCALP